MFVLIAPFVAISGYNFTRQWFMRLDDFALGVPGSAIAASALLAELRQRQLVAVLRRGRAFVENALSRLPGAASASRSLANEGPPSMMGSATDAALDLTVVEDMYERAMAGQQNGPLLRLFLADYIR